MKVFPELLIEDLRAEIEPERLGRQAGERGMPPLNATDDPGQTEIEEFIEAKKNDAVRIRDEQLEQVDSHLDQLDQAVLAGDLESSARKAATEFREVEQSELQALKASLHEFERKRRDFFDFKHRNGLDREPDYVSQRTTLLLVGLIVLLFVIESGLNGAFLAVGSEGGLVGGWGLALGFSVVNLVLPALFFGPVSRYVSHIHMLLKAVGVLAILGWLGTALVLNLGLAHFRDASADLIENIGAEALSRFQASPLGLHDAESWLLFVLGFFFSGVAFFDGRKLFGDSYPGYSRKHRKMEDARADYDDLWQDVVEQLRTIREDGLDAIRRTAHQAKSQPVERRRALESEAKLLAAFDTHVEQLQRFGTMLIEEYREANRSVRFDRGVPEAYGRPWGMDPPGPHRRRREPDAVEDVDLETLNEQYESALGRVHGEWEQTRARLDLEGSMSGPAEPVSANGGGS